MAYEPSTYGSPSRIRRDFRSRTIRPRSRSAYHRQDNGTKFRVVEFPPLDAATEATMEPNFLQNAVGERAPKRGVPVTHPLMHRTRSVDYAVILSGEIEMKLDDTVVHLKPGDVVVQQATNHAWVNRGTQPCRILFVLMDAKQP